ncbi:MAG: DUF2339 domain-containing protein [Eggerthellaceae bacterium]|nr:DUF2339 domain-containing protein [Eggerthellaceae bacterium]
MNTAIRTDLPTPPNSWLAMQNPQPEPFTASYGGMGAETPTATQSVQAAGYPIPPTEPPTAYPAGDTPSSASATRRESAEMWLGKNAASVIAAILVFIGLVLLGSAVFPQLSDGARVAVMFGVSGTLAAAGCLLELRKGNGLTLALMCCGMASLLISTVVMRSFFGIAPEAVGFAITFALLAVRLFAGERSQAQGGTDAFEQPVANADNRFRIVALVFAALVAAYMCVGGFPYFSEDIGVLGAAILGAVYLVVLVGFGIMLMRFMRPSSAGVVGFAVACTMLLMSYLRCCTPLAGEESAWSVCCMACALVCAVIGFKMNVGGLRLYGLILTLTCVVKLVVFDIGGAGTLERAVAFMVGGLICFAISALYNYAVKRLAVSGE